jgi:hypothetical protein
MESSWRWQRRKYESQSPLTCPTRSSSTQNSSPNVVWRLRLTGVDLLSARWCTQVARWTCRFSFWSWPWLWRHCGLVSTPISVSSRMKVSHSSASVSAGSSSTSCVTPCLCTGTKLWAHCAGVHIVRLRPSTLGPLSVPRNPFRHSAYCLYHLL